MILLKFDCCQMFKFEVVVIVVVVVGMFVLVFVVNFVIECNFFELKWDKVVCCFCGIGCFVMVVIKDNCVVVIYGDIKVEVNCGFNCVKGYFLFKIMYGYDCLMQLMLCKINGKYDKNGEFMLVFW